MYFRKTLHAQQENVDQGTLQITVRSEADNRPVENALVRISYTGDPNSVIEEGPHRFFRQYPCPPAENAAFGIQLKCY